MEISDQQAERNNTPVTNYTLLSGTSMATPVVSGSPSSGSESRLDPDQVKARLMKTAYKTFPASSVATDPATGQTYTSYYDLFTVGAGYLDIAAALNNNDKAPAAAGSALSPSAVYNPVTGTVSLVNGSSVVWAQSSSLGQFGGLGHFRRVGHERQRQFGGLGHVGGLGNFSNERLQRGLGYEHKLGVCHERGLGMLRSGQHRRSVS
jgi:hypothetical protein